MPSTAPIPLDAPRSVPYDLRRPIRLTPKTCHLCEERYTAWQDYKAAHIYRRGVRVVADRHIEYAGFLMLLFMAHIDKCRIVQKSLLEPRPTEDMARHNRSTRDVQQAAQYRGWRDSRQVQA